MKEFEVIGADGRTYLHYNNWLRWRSDRLREYPCAEGKFRFDIELAYPCYTLREVPVSRNPHSFPGMNGHTCFYECDNWSTIYGVHDAHLHEDVGGWRMLIESGNNEPLWGEPITLFSTASCIETEPWGRNPSNRFAFFRGKFWLIKWAEFLNEWLPPIRYPLTNMDSLVRRPREYTVDTDLVRSPRQQQQQFFFDFTPTGQRRFPRDDTATFSLEYLQLLMGMGTVGISGDYRRRMPVDVNWQHEGF